MRNQQKKDASYLNIFCCPLSTGYMPQPGTNKHQSRIAIREDANNPRSASNLTVKPFDHVVSSDTQPVFIREVHVRQGFLNPVLNLLGRFIQLYLAQRVCNLFRFLSGRSLALLGMDGLKHLATRFILPRGVAEKTLR